MFEAMCTKFSHVLHQFLTFQSIHCASSRQLIFPPFYIVLKPRLTVSGELQIGWEVGDLEGELQIGWEVGALEGELQIGWEVGALEGRQDGVQKLKRKAMG